METNNLTAPIAVEKDRNTLTLTFPAAPFFVAILTGSCRVIFRKLFYGYPASGNFLFFVVCMMSLFRLPCSKLPLVFLAVPAGKDGRVECPCQTVDDFIGIGGSVCGLFLFVQTHAPLIVPPWQSRARKSKFHFYQAQGRGCFPPCSCGWWLVDGLQVPVVMRFLYRSAFLQTVPYTLCAA